MSALHKKFPGVEVGGSSSMKSSNIGGQAVMEGVMMRNADKYAVAVRKTDGEIVVKTEEYKGIVQNKKIRSLPIIRGVFSFIDSMVLGMSTLTYSASFFMDEEEEEKDEKKESVMMGLTIACSVVMAVAIFMILPYFASLFFVTVVSKIYRFYYFDHTA